VLNKTEVSLCWLNSDAKSILNRYLKSGAFPESELWSVELLLNFGQKIAHRL